MESNSCAEIKLLTSHYRPLGIPEYYAVKVTTLFGAILNKTEQNDIINQPYYTDVTLKVFHI